MILVEVGAEKNDRAADESTLHASCSIPGHVTHPVSGRVAVLTVRPLLATKDVWPNLPSPELLHCGPLIYQRTFGLEFR